MPSSRHHGPGHPDPESDVSRPSDAHRPDPLRPVSEPTAGESGTDRGSGTSEDAPTGPEADGPTERKSRSRRNPALMEVRVRRAALVLLVAVPLIYFLVTNMR